MDAWRAPRWQIWHAQTRNPFCPGMLATILCRKSDRVDSSVNGYFRSFRAEYSRNTPREGARLEKCRDSDNCGIVQDNMGHVEYRRDPCFLQQTLAGRGRR